MNNQTHTKKPFVFCLLGPTSSGKTTLALELTQHFPFEIISVDSAMVYCGMDIGTAKPSKEILKQIPHHLIDICDPSHAYSAGEFRRNCEVQIQDILSRQRIPLLVGGTMLYFNVLLNGLAELPTQNEKIRQELQKRSEQEGLQALHKELAVIDKNAAQRINPNDAQRIQRALEVFLITGKTISAWQAENTGVLSEYQFYSFGLIPEHRDQLHQRIAVRFDAMLAEGLIDEVMALYARQDLTAHLPAMRSVGYRQVWEYLAKETSYEMMQQKAIAATRQLAKRQLTWLRSWKNLTVIHSDSGNVLVKMRDHLKQWI